MPASFRTPFDEAHNEQTLEEALAATVRCARAVEFWRRFLPDLEVRTLHDLGKLPLASRVELSMASRLSELITDPRWLFRSTYPFNQNVCTFPFQVVAGELDLYIRHERMKAILETAGFVNEGETLILVSPAHYFFAADLCAEIFFEGHHCSLQDVSTLSAGQIREKIEAFDAQLVVVAAEGHQVCPEAIPPSVEAVMTFRGAYPDLAKLEVKVVDVYSLTEAPYLGHRLAGERCYRYNKDHFYIERSPAGLLTFTSLLWEVMPFIRYQTYDGLGMLDDSQGLIEITSFGEW